MTDTTKDIPKVCFITAIYGPYEATCKPAPPQTIPADFVCFTDRPDIPANGWQVDTTPYHLNNPSNIDTGKYRNSIRRNKTNFNIAKYYKQNFYNIPRLAKYDVIVWLDGSVLLLSEKVAEYCLQKCQAHKIVTWEHEDRGGLLSKEAENSMTNGRYTELMIEGIQQPFQDVQGQFETYVKEGYPDTYFKELAAAQGRENFGVWLTCFVAFDQRAEGIREFLDMWYLQTLKYTTQDQVGFPYTVWKTGIIPYTLPDNTVKGERPHQQTDFYRKLMHGV
jgi:hypothetical protein